MTEVNDGLNMAIKLMQEGHTNDVVSMCFVIRLFLLRFISAEE